MYIEQDGKLDGVVGNLEMLEYNHKAMNATIAANYESN